MTKIINLVGGPCSGKSTVAAGLFYLMKSTPGHSSVELVTEVMKDYTYDENKGMMNDQILITAVQNHRLVRLLGKVDTVVTDTSLFNGVVYTNDEHGLETRLALDLFRGYDNVVLFMPRKGQYEHYGRTQTEDEARQIDTRYREMLDKYEVPYIDFAGMSHDNIPESIVEHLKSSKF